MCKVPNLSRSNVTRRPLFGRRLPAPGRLGRPVEEVLRELAYVLHLTRQVRTSIRRQPAAPRREPAGS